MTPFKRTEITIETDHILVIRRYRSTRAWCPGCACEVDMVDPEAAEVFTAASRQAFSRRSLQDSAWARQWHTAEGPEGSVLICLESLLKHEQNEHR
jgi:hypothetical protein